MNRLVSKQYRGEVCHMRGAVYNSGIPNVSANSVGRGLPLAHILCVVAQLSFILLGLGIAARAADWNGPEQQLARKIVAATGPGAVVFTVENRSSLGKRDQEIIQNGLRSALETVGIRFMNAEQAAAAVTITLSENLASYIWVAEVRQGLGEAAKKPIRSTIPPRIHQFARATIRDCRWEREMVPMSFMPRDNNESPTEPKTATPTNTRYLRNVTVRLSAHVQGWNLSRRLTGHRFLRF